MEVSFSHTRRFLWTSMFLFLLLTSLVSACDAGASSKTNTAPGCTALGAQPGAKGASASVMATVALPGQPFQARATNDGQWIFVSLLSKSAASNGIAVLQQRNQQVCLKRVVPLTGTPLGLTMTAREDLLLVANHSGIAVVDAKRAEQGSQGAVLGYVQEPKTASTVEVAISPDEHYAFTTNQDNGTLGVIDFQRLRADDFNPDALLGLVQLGAGLLGLAMSMDNRHLYITTGAQSETAASQSACTTPGSLMLLDVQRILSDPTHAVIAKVAAGCDPARVYLSNTEATAWVAVRGENKLLAFNTLTLLDDPKNALVGSVVVGPVPTGMGIAQNGQIMLVANSNRFAQPRQPQMLSVLSVHNIIQGQPATLTSIKVGEFPREVTVENDDQTVLLTNFNSNSLTIINATKLPKSKN